jgi:hypothetical protein
VINAPSAWFGWNPLVNPTLTPGQTQSISQHPWAAGIGRATGEVLGAAPAIVGSTLAGEAVLPAAASVPFLLARGAGIGASTGALQGALTAGEQFQPGGQESLGSRIGWGAAFGGAGGLLGGAAEAVGGGAKSIAPEVQQAGRSMQNAGVDVTGPNLLAGTAPSATQVGQLNRGWGNIFGQTTPDFSAPTLNAVIPKLGQDVGNAARAGQINLGATLSDGSTLDAKLADIEKDASLPRITNLISRIRSQFSTSGIMAGDDIADVLKTDNPLDKAVRSNTPEISEAAADIEAALKDGFQSSSPPGVGDAYSLAREKYKLALVGEKASDPVTGNLDPSRLLRVMGQMYPDSRMMGGGTSLSDQAVQYARNAARLYGGSAAPGGPSWVQTAGQAVLGGIGAGALHFLPGVAANPLLGAGLVAAPLVLRGAGALGRMYQRSVPYAANLLRQGTAVPNPLLPAAGGVVGGVTAP